LLDGENSEDKKANNDPQGFTQGRGMGRGFRMGPRDDRGIWVKAWVEASEFEVSYT